MRHSGHSDRLVVVILECGCNLTGSRNRSCSGSEGVCACLPGVAGNKCDRCLPQHFGYDDGSGCRRCNCDPLGARHGNCTSDSGQCSCKAGIVTSSRTCSECGDGFFNLSNAGCQSEFCAFRSTSDEKR